MNLIEICIIYNDQNQIYYLKNLLKILNLEEKIHLVFEKYHSNTEFAYNKYLFIDKEAELKTTDKFIVLLNEECSYYSQYIQEFKTLNNNNKIHIFSSNPCFEAFLISHFITNFHELHEKCKNQELLSDGQIDRYELIGEEINTSCNHCEKYLQNDFIYNYRKNSFDEFKNHIGKNEIIKSNKQLTVIADLINYLQQFIPNILR